MNQQTSVRDLLLLIMGVLPTDEKELDDYVAKVIQASLQEADLWDLFIAWSLRSSLDVKSHDPGEKVNEP